MNWIGRKIHLYNVTMGLYMLDFWEQCLFNLLMLVLLWFILYNTTCSASEFYKRGSGSCYTSSVHWKVVKGFNGKASLQAPPKKKDKGLKSP